MSVLRRRGCVPRIRTSRQRMPGGAIAGTALHQVMYLAGSSLLNKPWDRPRCGVLIPREHCGRHLNVGVGLEDGEVAQDCGFGLRHRVVRSSTRWRPPESPEPAPTPCSRSAAIAWSEDSRVRAAGNLDGERQAIDGTTDPFYRTPVSDVAIAIQFRRSHDEQLRRFTGPHRWGPRRRSPGKPTRSRETSIVWTSGRNRATAAASVLTSSRATSNPSHTSRVRSWILWPAARSWAPFSGRVDAFRRGGDFPPVPTLVQ